MDWKVALSDITLGPEERTAVNRVMESGWISMGPEIEQFEYEFADYLRVDFAVAVSSGTTALHLALAAAEIGAGDEVILPSLTFVATANAVIYQGAVPVFADVGDLSDWNLSLASIEKKLSSKTRAIIAVHYGGFPCMMDQLRELAATYNLKIIEDAAHAPGAVYQDRKLGTWGDVGCFSFFSNKNMTTAEGGMVVTDNPEIARRVRLLRSHGMTTLTWDRHKGHSFSYDVVETGFNYRMDEIRAAIGRVQLAKLEENNEKRKWITRKMRQLISDIDGVFVPFSDNLIESSSCHIFPIFLEDKDIRPLVMASMRNSGIQTSIHYPPVHRFSVFSSSDRAPRKDLRFTELIAEREITLPLFPGMTDYQMELVIEKLKLSLSAARRSMDQYTSAMLTPSGA
ncbi:DegT/DnrJ/EryC1/StrS family aminotransferase [Desulfomonile tiedjei]|nr:DegT/DnrJ/EryC1/StrS family aminotransferase [Desulfomonile tiedjei]